ncbi:MAG: hypothetical protein ABII90_14285, partial [Bacteroidota bacterium]
MSKAQEIEEKTEISSVSVEIMAGLNYPLSGFTAYKDIYYYYGGYKYNDHTAAYSASPLLGFSWGMSFKYRVNNYLSLQLVPSYSNDRGKINVDSLDIVKTGILNLSVAGLIDFTDHISGSIGPSAVGYWINYEPGSPFIHKWLMWGLNVGGVYQMDNGFNIGVKYNFNIGKLVPGNTQYLNASNNYQDYELHNPTHLQVLLGYNFTFKRKKDKEIDELKDM